MKTIVNVKELRDSIQYINTVNKGDNTVLLHAEDSSLVITRLSMNTVIVRLKINADVQEQGSIYVNAQVLLNVLKTVKKGDITITITSINRDKAELKFGQMSINIDVLDMDYPTDTLKKLKTLDEREADMVITSNNLTPTIIKKCLPIIRRQRGDRPALLNGLITQYNNNNYLVYTDAYRLSASVIHPSVKPNEDILIPNYILTALSKIPNNKEISIVDTSEGVAIICDNITIMDLSGQKEKFPDWQIVIPTEASGSAVVKKGEIINPLELIVKNKIEAVLEFTKDKLTITAESGFTSIINCQSSFSDKFTIRFTPAYLLDALNAIDTEDVAMFFTDEEHAVRFSSSLTLTEDSNVYLLMPRRK